MEAIDTTPITATQRLKTELCNKLAVFGKTLTENGALQVGLSIGISFRTVMRYSSGDIKEVRRTELAEQILAALEKLKNQQPQI